MSTIAAPRRADGRLPNQLRPVKIVPDYLKFAEGSALIRVGETRVLCAATLEDRVPPFLRGKGTGWVTAEYSMLPRAGTERTPREASTGRIGGRTHEIQRLIGRSLRSVVDLGGLGERSLTLDCDVLQADGGTRTASVTGAWTALALATWRLRRRGAIDREPLLDSIAAVSVGLVDGRPLLDLPYEEDARAEVDMNVVATGTGRLAEIQGTGEGTTFSRAELDALTDLALRGIEELTRVQREALRAAGALE